ncbi:MAG: protein phosphatase 2C domain-containing protein [Planctomycetota bacterium]
MGGGIKESDPLSSWAAQRDAELHDSLASCGKVYRETAQLSVAGTRVSFASLAGRKAVNEDAAAVWVAGRPGSIRWAAAVADGVSACLLPELGSSLACLSALAAVAAHQGEASGLRPIAAASEAMQQLAEAVAGRPEAWRPGSVSRSMWKRVLRDGAYFQTTLTVVWEADDGLYVEGLGDGGFSVGVEGGSMGFVPNPSLAVSCIGPGRSDSALYWHSYARWRDAAVFTDGLSPWVENGGDPWGCADAAGALEACLEADETTDNLTLLLVSREAA